MVGRDVELRVAEGTRHAGRRRAHLEDVVVRDDRDHVAVQGVSLDVRAGEIVAIAGVQGNGQTELVEAIVGLRTTDSGAMTVNGTDIVKASPRHVSDIGVAHIPEDRGRDGLINYMTVSENYILDSYHRAPYSKGVRLDLEAIRPGRAATGVRDFDIRTPSIHTLAGSLSGGNQQKVVVAREFSRPVKLVIAAQPTRGLDVGSIEYIHKRIVEQRDAGAAILIVSTELEEVLAVGDRVAVMFGGRIVGILEGDEATFENGRHADGRRTVSRLRRILGPALVPALAVLTAFIVGSIFILITDFENLQRLGTDPLGAIGVRGRRHHRGLPVAARRGVRRPGAHRGRHPGRPAAPGRGGHPAAHRDARRGHPADLHRPRRRRRLPDQRVQHRRGGPVHPRARSGRRPRCSSCRTCRRRSRSSARPSRAC